jgi:4,5-dihydroxyphthalate decarboxylase
MHVIVLRRSLAEAHPWLTASLTAAFTAALDLAVADLHRRDFPKIALPGQLAAAEAAAATYGAGLWTYGLEPNRAVLDAALRHACADGLAGPDLTPDALFQ